MPCAFCIARAGVLAGQGLAFGCDHYRVRTRECGCPIGSCGRQQGWSRARSLARARERPPRGSRRRAAPTAGPRPCPSNAPARASDRRRDTPLFCSTVLPWILHECRKCGMHQPMRVRHLLGCPCRVLRVSLQTVPPHRCVRAAGRGTAPAACREGGRLCAHAGFVRLRHRRCMLARSLTEHRPAPRLLHSGRHFPACRGRDFANYRERASFRQYDCRHAARRTLCARRLCQHYRSGVDLGGGVHPARRWAC